MMGRVKSVQLRGLKTAWVEAGYPDRPLLVLLHGYPDSPETWEFQIEHFSRDYHVIAPFSRGAGESEPAKSVRRYGSDAVSLDLLQIFEHVNPARNAPVILVGHDLGAVHAWNLAPLLGTRLQALVIVNGLSLQAMMGRLGSLAQHRRSWYIYGVQLPWVPEFLARRFPDALLDVAHRLGKLPAPHRLHGGQVQNCLAAPLNQYRAFVRDIPKIRRRRLPRLQCPVLVVWGKEDPALVTPRVSEWEAAAVDITTRILPAGHWVHRERAPEVNRIFEKFFITRLQTASRRLPAVTPREAEVEA